LKKCAKALGMQLKMDLNNLLDIAVQAAKKAGAYLNEQKNTEMKVNSAIGRDIKLELDKNTEILIRDYLAQTNIPVMGEEISSKFNSNIYWIVDPIDGTANYFRGLDQCCVSIALAHNNDFVIGVIYNFNTDELFSAQKDNGAFVNGKKISVSNISSKEKSSITTGFPASESIESSLEFLEGLQCWKKIRMFGSAALSCAYVASGRCDAYIEKGVYLWDFAAGICLVKEAGGRVDYTKLDSDRYAVNFDNNCL
jgi:myo-inositol-1(or 4)-monophosphatase